MKRVNNHFGDDLLEKFSYTPTLLWFMNWEKDLNFCLDFLASSGLILSATVVISGASNMFIMTALWLGFKYNHKNNKN